MKNPLHKELEDLGYISISSIDPYDIPESVVIYFKNNSKINKKMSIETIHGTQLDLQNQNPTIVLENYKATFCLGSTSYVPTVTIDPIDDILDPEYPREITFTGTVSRTDDYIPNDILVEYVGITMRASLVDDTHWTVTFNLQKVTVDTTQTVSAIANSIDVNSSVISGYSEIVTSEFNIIFLEVECTPSVDRVSCLCLDVTKNYKVTVDGQSITGTFEEVVTFLDSHGLYAYPSKTKCNPAPTISCDGATPEAWFTNGSGAFHITVNGEFFENTNNWGVGYMINQIPELAAILNGEGGSGFRFFNKSPKFLRIKLEPIQSNVWGIKAGNNNPTIDINDDGVIQFCLCPDTPPQTTLLRLQTSDGNTLFSGVADNLTLINSANQIVYSDCGDRTFSRFYCGIPFFKSFR